MGGLPICQDWLSRRQTPAQPTPPSRLSTSWPSQKLGSPLRTLPLQLPSQLPTRFTYPKTIGATRGGLDSSSRQSGPTRSSPWNTFPIKRYIAVIYHPPGPPCDFFVETPCHGWLQHPTREVALSLHLQTSTVLSPSSLAVRISAGCRTELRAVERKLKRSDCADDFSHYLHLLSDFTSTVSASKSTFYQTKINSSASNHRKLFSMFPFLLTPPFLRQSWWLCILLY